MNRNFTTYHSTKKLKKKESNNIIQELNPSKKTVAMIIQYASVRRTEKLANNSTFGYILN